MFKTRAVLIGIAVAASMWLAAGAGAWAEDSARIDSSACVALGTEKSNLEKTGIEEELERGADWGKANLKPERLRQVERYIYLDEIMTFRCPDVLAAAAVRQMEEQARLKALAALERERLWLERMKKIPPPVRKPKTKIARSKPASKAGVPPLPERKSR